ncbi:MAG: membrane dipeptidase, partial [Bacteroidota bacterium]
GKSRADIVLRSVTGIDGHQLKSLRKKNDYFDELAGQYAFLSRGQGKSPDGQYSYRLAGNYDELQQILNSDPNCIAVVVTVEGAHAFNAGLRKRGGYTGAKEQEVVENIGTEKAWKYPPFFINLAHHFYNELCGHTRSMKMPMYQIYNQKKGLNTGITDIGWRVIHELLAKDNGRRILLDIKHMSVKSRVEFYRFVESYNRLNPSDQIPVICSHTGVNAFSTMKGSRKRRDNLVKLRNSYFHNWAINLSDEELRIIHRSGGLIGIMADKGLLGSPGTLKEIEEMEGPEVVRKAFTELVAKTIFHIIRVIGDKSAWDLLALGTDYDGLITHIDTYPNAEALPDLQADLVNFIKENNYERELWFGYEPEELVRKTMQTNAMNFLATHFC